MKNVKAAGAPGLLWKMIKSVGEARCDVISELINLIIVVGVTPAGQVLTAIVNYTKQNRDVWERKI